MFAGWVAKKVIVSLVVTGAIGTGVAASASTSASPHLRARHVVANHVIVAHGAPVGSSGHRSRYVPSVVNAIHPFRIAANIIGIRWQTLYRDVMLHGATIASVAVAHGVDPQLIVDAIGRAGLRFDAREAGRFGPARLQIANGRMAKWSAHVVNSHGATLFWHPKVRSGVAKAHHRHPAK